MFEHANFYAVVSAAVPALLYMLSLLYVSNSENPIIKLIAQEKPNTYSINVEKKKNVNNDAAIGLIFISLRVAVLHRRSSIKNKFYSGKYECVKV